MICPKCHYEQADSPSCVHCGVIFAKYQAYLDHLEQNKVHAQQSEKDIELENNNRSHKQSALFSFLSEPWKPVSTPVFTFLTILFFLHIFFFPKSPQVAGWSLFTNLIHNVNLVFHEAGHILFGLFGNHTLMVLGGSLNQILIPFIVASSFTFYRDQGGAGFALIWFFGNFIDVSIYMADGRFLKLPLIGGLDLEAHDWRNLFNHFDLWEVDQTLSKIVFYTGWVGIFLTWVWIYKNWRNTLKTR